MNETIVKFALREVILNENLNLSDFTRKEALDELIRRERREVLDLNTRPVVWANHFAEFREHRMQNDRIPTIKLVREKLQCGLSEAMIIVRGIEARFDIQ
jgi:hypothetical protein